MLVCRWPVGLCLVIARWLWVVGLVVCWMVLVLLLGGRMHLVLCVVLGMWR